ncbi:NAD-dependent epimerase/dehydratase family protein [Natranaerovirga pectinivora]|nr:NAD-dependent epimerase/dehydratase family protein [Natranaerovirga pectinivora]
MKVLVLGGTGVISRAIVVELLNKNYEVTIFNRGNNTLFDGQVEQIIGDRNNKEQFESAFKNRFFDVVIDMISFHEQDAIMTVDTFKNQTSQIIFTSSVAAYKRPYNTLPIIEEKESLCDDPSFLYAYKKAEMERYLHTVIEEGILPITIVRPSLTYGIGAANIGVLRQNYGIVDRIKKGKPLIMFGDGTNPWSFTFAPDLAKGYVALVGNKKAYGEAYHITNEDRQMWKDLYLEIGKIVGIEPIINYLPSEILYKGNPDLFTHIHLEKCYPGIFDNSKIKRDAPEYEATIGLNEGLKEIINWFEASGKYVDPEKDALEDKLVEVYRQLERNIQIIN